MKYSQQEIDQILLSKELNEFYLAIIERKPGIITDEEYIKLMKKNKKFQGNDEEQLNTLLKIIKDDDILREHETELMRLVYSTAQIRHSAILTTIGDGIYNIANAEFVDLKRSKIINYDNFANYYNDLNARIRFFTPREEPHIKRKMVLMDIDDLASFMVYEQNHLHQYENSDLTIRFLKEANGRSYAKKVKSLTVRNKYN